MGKVKVIESLVQGHFLIKIAQVELVLKMFATGFTDAKNAQMHSVETLSGGRCLNE